MNASPKLQIAAPLTFSTQSMNSSDYISSFLLFFYLICRFLTYIPIFIFFLASRNPFSNPSFHRISACLHFFTSFFSSCIFFLTFFLSFFLSLFISFYSFSSYLSVFIFLSIIYLFHCYFSICPLFPSLGVLRP